MSAFVAGGLPPQPETPEQNTLENAPFWPSFDLDDLRQSLRIDASVTHARLRDAAVEAMMSVNRELAGWRKAQQEQGYTTLAAVPGESINGVSEHQQLYRRAVYAATGAEVCERYRSYDTTGTGDRKAEDLQSNIDEYRRDQRWAIRDLLRVSRSTVELL